MQTPIGYRRLTLGRRRPWRRGALAAAVLMAALAGVAARGEPSPAGRLARVLATGSLRVCIWPDYFGVTYRNPRTQQLGGIDIDLAQALAKDLGPEVTVTFIDSSFARLIGDVSEDRCDVAMFAVGVTAARAERLRFSRPYLRSDIYAVTTRSNRRIQRWDDIDRSGVVVAVAKGTYHELVMRERLEHARLLVLDTPFAREREVESGRADVFMTDYPYSQRMLQNAEWARLVAPPAPYQLTPYAYAVAPGDEEWLSRIDRFVADIQRDGRLLAAARRHRLDAIAVLP